MQVFKPGSVSFFLLPKRVYLSFIYATYPIAAPVSGIRRAALNRNLFGLTTPEVYPAPLLLKMPVSSYLTFSLSPRSKSLRFTFGATLLSVALSVTGAFLPWHPSFQMAGCPMLPGLSSPASGKPVPGR